jgi:hypothetical protein
MRNGRMRRKSLLLTILALSLTLAPGMFAQQRSAVSATAADSTQEDRRAIPVNGDCPLTPYAGGNQDSFNPPVESTTMSPGLQAYFISNGVTSTGITKPRQYDEEGQNKWFGQSFRIKCCKVCRAELEIGVKNLGGLASNDAIYVGRPPFTGANLIVGGHIWDNTRPTWAGGTASPKTMTIPLSPAALNNYIFNSGGCNVPIDILVQDDTAVDYIKLKIWTY